MVRFYGFGWQEVEDMPLNLYYKYLFSIGKIKSMEQLDSIEVSCFPTLSKQKSKSKIVDYHTKNLRPDDYIIKVLTSEELQEQLMSRMTSNG